MNHRDYLLRYNKGVFPKKETIQQAEFECRCGHCEPGWKNLLEYAIEAGIDTKDTKAVRKFFSTLTVDTLANDKN